MSEVHKCCKTIWSGHTSYPCGKKAKFERDGKHYCGIHDPVARDAKYDAKKAKWDAEAKARKEARDAPFKRIKELEAELSSLRLKLEAAGSALISARQKLELYRGAHSGEYIGGLEYTHLIKVIDEALRTIQVDREKK